jgi:GNAT superfamily N-acetyltransferase
MTEQGAGRPEDGFRIRRMTRDDMDLAVSWAASEGWNPGRNDAECFYQTDPDGFFMGELDGEPMGCVSMVAYDDTFAFGGFYIVAPEHRAKGYGIQLFKAAMEYAGDRNVGGDGVVEQQANYKRVGFVTAHRNIRFEGQGGGTMFGGVVSLADVQFEILSAYDRRHFPAARDAFLECWISRPHHTALGLVKDGQLKGYGVIRPCVNGHKIGPLFADGPAEAEKLFHSLVAFAPSGPVYLDVPVGNAAALELAEDRGMSQVFETARMYTKGAPDLPMDEIFGVTSFELG